ncbi:MAG: ABC transporter ATP-binding protein [Spirochaetota bacterium]
MHVDRVEFTYRSKTSEVPLFRQLTRTFEPGSIHAVIGASGCGKTTLLYLLAGLYIPDSGTILFEEADAEHSTQRAIILQDYGLFPWKRVRENISLGLRLRGESTVQTTEKTERIMEELGIAHLARAYPAKISGGERQRVAIARAVVLEPKVLLMDEPFSSLDAMNREHMQELLLTTHRQHSMTVVLVTHSIEEAAYVSSHIHVMRRSDASGIADFAPELPGIGKQWSRRSQQFHAAVDAVRSQLEEP